MLKEIANMCPVTLFVHPELFIEQRSAATLSEVFLSAFLRKAFYFLVTGLLPKIPL